MTQIRDTGPPVMQRMAEAIDSAPYKPGTQSLRLAPTKLAGVTNGRLYREVFGFAFASSLGDPNIGYPSWNMSLLSTVAYFGLHVDWTGEFSSGSGLTIWNDPNGPVPGLISTAHANGTKVVLTIELFDSTNGTPNMCSALNRSNVTIQNTVNEVMAKGVDGVNIDYESNNTTCADPGTPVRSSQSLFTSFVASMRAALPAGHNYLSVDTYSGAAGYRDASGNYLGFFDIGGLNNYVDSFFVMAYDMEYSNWDSPPLSCSSFCLGPTAPVTNYVYNDTRASSEYRAALGSGAKVIMGIPYYGRKECVAVPAPSQIPPNAVGSSVAADGYLDASTEMGYPGNTLYTKHRDANDPVGSTEWDTFSSTSAGCNREMYWDDTVSLGNKYNLIINDHLRGAGIFALNYGGGAPELWNLINLKFGQCSQASVNADHTSPQIPATKVTFTATALCAGTGTFRFSLQAPGATGFAVQQDYSTSSTWTWDSTNQPLGTYQVKVEARNQGSTAAFDTSAVGSMRLALCVTPALGANPSTPQLTGTAIGLSAAVTCQTTPEYRFSVLPPGGAWTVVQPYGSASSFNWTTHPAYGNYQLMVSTRTVGTTVDSESTETIPFTLQSCITAALATSKASPQPTGSTIGLTASATCDGTAQYRFMIKSPSGVWTTPQDFGPGTTYSWSVGGPPGLYTLEADARSATAPISSESTAQVSYTVSGCTGAMLTPSPVAPQEPGGTITLTGAATCQGTAQFRFTIQNPGAAARVVQDYSPSSTYGWNTSGLPYGVYQLKLDARNVGATSDSETAATLGYSLQAAACAAPTDSSSLVQSAGNTAYVNISATSGVCPHPVYQFWILTPGSTTWTLAQAYSASSSFHWTTTGQAPGSYTFSVWVRDASRPGVQTTGLGNLDAYTDLTYAYTPCSAASISAAPISSVLAGGTVTVTGGASGCASPQYEFWTLAPGGGWKIAQPYGSSPTFSWSTAGPLATGQYHLSVWVRDGSSTGANAGATGSYDASAATTYALTSQPCTGATLSATPANTAPAGTPVSVNAAATGCPAPLYEFWLQAPGAAWRVVQPYGSSASLNWNTAGLQSGGYRLSVWVRDGSSSAAYDAFAPGAAYGLTTTACTAGSASAAPASPQPAGTVVNITATASTCPYPRYEFWIRAPGGSWTVAQAYSSNATFTWNTAPPAGTYQYSVWVRDASSTAAYDTFFPGTAYTLTTTPCTGVTATPAPASPQPAGTAITITANASGCPNPRYEFWMLAPGGSWTIVQAYSSSSSFAWNTAASPAGTYRYSVWVRDGSSGAAYDAYLPGTGYSLS